MLTKQTLGSIAAVAVAFALPQVASAQEGGWVQEEGRTYYSEPADAQVTAAPPAAQESDRDRSRRRKKDKRPPRQVNVGMTVAGGIFTGLGAMAFLGGLAGYFATIDCTSGFIFPSCTDQPEILLVSLAGIVTATAIGTPLLVVGLRRRAPATDSPVAPDVEPEPSVSLQLGPVSGLRVTF
jgi:hypothetical protein